MRNTPEEIDLCAHGQVRITLGDEVIVDKSEKGNRLSVSAEEYKTEVVDFVNKVEDFYEQSKPKTLPNEDYDRIGYEKFWREWKRRLNEIAD